MFVKISSEFVVINQTCYVSVDDMIKNSNIIKQYIKDNRRTYLEFGKKDGNYTPAFSMELFPCDDYGHIVSEVDMKIADNETRRHRCQFFIKTELGLLEEFGEKLKSINEMELNECICLYDE